jgi:exopolyphosphatase / guanosine-5'-triphosphate,3'-diphosphate pyrophosphatase
MRVAAVDCGTNSIRLLITDSGRTLHRELRIVRLGQGVDRTGRLAPEAIERTRAALADYAQLIAAHEVSRVRMVATSATRDAENRDEFVAIVGETLGVEPEVVTGAEEAELSFSGAVETVNGLTGSVLLVDLGGGSTELVLGSAGSGHARAAFSMDVGSVRMTERHLHDDPPTAEQVDAVVADVNAAIDEASADVPIADADALVGVAGTITTVAAMVLGLHEYDSDAIHGARISRTQIADVTDRLAHMTHDERAAVRVIHPGRVDVITAGAIILRTVVERAALTEIVVSEHDILDGIAASIG